MCLQPSPDKFFRKIQLEPAVYTPIKPEMGHRSVAFRLVPPHNGSYLAQASYQMALVEDTYNRLLKTE